MTVRENKAMMAADLEKSWQIVTDTICKPEVLRGTSNRILRSQHDADADADARTIFTGKMRDLVTEAGRPDPWPWSMTMALGKGFLKMCLDPVHSDRTSVGELKVVVEDVIVQHSLQVLEEQGLAVAVLPWFQEYLKHHLQSQVAAEFWKRFQDPVSNETVISFMQDVFQRLYDDLSAFDPCIQKLDEIHKLLRMETPSMPALSTDVQSLQNQFQLYVKAIIFNKSTKHFQEAVFSFYQQAFKSFDASTKSSGLDDSELGDDDCLKCDGCEQEREACQCSHILDTFHQLNQHLRALGLLERLSGESVSSLIHQRIYQHVEHTCKGNFEVEFIQTLENWLETKVVNWLELLYGAESSKGQILRHSPGGAVHPAQGVDNKATPMITNNVSENHPNTIKSHKERLYHYMYDIYAKIRIQQLFTIIVDYPESLPALQDLKTCLEKTDLRTLLVHSLKHALETRLLHPGVNTGDILTAYTHAIRALRVLDPSGVLLDLVCQPVRKYLRNRDDTVRCIVSSLTDDSSNDLNTELIRGHPLVMDDDSYHSDDDTDDWENWQPDPVDADPSKSSSSRRSSYIISILVNIYGSKELFVNEYRTLLADRILTHFNYATEKEIRYLELLKLSFGESQLHFCEVMLKDVADSRRINSHITEQRVRDKNSGKQLSDSEKIPVTAMILSAEFWPAFREEKVDLPEFLKDHLKHYTTSFEALKGNRTLNWKPHLGQMQIEVELKGGRSLELSVSPVHATILWHFQDKDRWSVEELGSVMQMSAQALRRKLAFWQSHGLLREESTDTYVLVEEGRCRNHDAVMVMEEEEAESAMASAQDQKEEELQVLWSYVVGMLTNLESLPLERIHAMLKMFAMQGPGSECSIQELKAFLDRKVREQKLHVSGGLYLLPKPGSE